MVPVATRCRIAELAAERGWSLGELARRTHISKSTLSSYATMRTSDMPLRNAIAISQVLDCHPAELYEWE